MTYQGGLCAEPEAEVEALRWAALQVNLLLDSPEKSGFHVKNRKGDRDQWLFLRRFFRSARRFADWSKLEPKEGDRLAPLKKAYKRCSTLVGGEFDMV